MKLWALSNIAKCFLWVACNLSNSFQASSPGFISHHCIFLHHAVLSEDCVSRTVTALLSHPNSHGVFTSHCWWPCGGLSPKCTGSQGLKCLRATSDWMVLHTPAQAMGSFHKARAFAILRAVSWKRQADLLNDWLKMSSFIYLLTPLQSSWFYSFFFLWTTEVNLYIFLIALLLSWFIWQFGAALLAGMEDLSFPYFFGWGYSHWSIVFFTELTSYKEKWWSLVVSDKKAHSLKINIKYD